MAGGIGATGPPQYAQFETGPNGLAVEPKVVNEDALPPMPSWEQAQKKRIAEDGDAVELGELDPGTGQRVPLMTGAAGISRSNSPGQSPVDRPFGDIAGANPNTGYMGPGAGAVGAGAMAMGARNNDPYGNGRGTPMDARNQNSNGRGGYPPSQGRGYDNQNQYNEEQSSYGGSQDNFRPMPAGTYQSRGPPQRQYSGSNGPAAASSRPYPNERQYSDAPSTQYSQSQPRPYGSAGGAYNQSQGQQRMVSPPINDNTGYDFDNSNNRPAPAHQQSYGSSQAYGSTSTSTSYAPTTNYAQSVAPSMPPSYRTNSPPQQEQGAYSGYQAYQAPQAARQQGRGIPGPRGGGGRGYDGY
jgi:hypothetical protein